MPFLAPNDTPLLVEEIVGYVPAVFDKHVSVHFSEFASDWSSHNSLKQNAILHKKVYFAAMVLSYVSIWHKVIIFRQISIFGTI